MTENSEPSRGAGQSGAAILDFLKRRWKKIIVWTMIIGISANVLLVGGVFIRWMFNRLDIKAALQEEKTALTIKRRVYRPPVRIYSSANQLIGEYLPDRGSHMSLKQCNSMVWLPRTAVASEDRHFFKHKGISMRGIMRAFINNLKSFSVREGAGSITQQLGRIMFTKRSESALPRKIYETIIAFQIEGTLTKKEILCLYLNKIYMGEGRVGAEQASRFYFRKAPDAGGKDAMTPSEAAMIVGLFPNPARYSPLNNIMRSMRKTELTLATLARDGWIKKKDIPKLLARFKRKYGVSVGKDLRSSSSGKIGRYGASRDFRRNSAPSANEYVRRFLLDNFEESVVSAGGLQVYTTIDYLRQREADRAVRAGVAKIRAKMLAVKKVTPARRRAIAARLNGVFVALDPRTGYIRAVTGGFRITEGGVHTHRAWRMRRQTGSALKGFLYAAALDEKTLTVDSKVLDEKINYAGYSPKNWYKGYRGEMTLRRAVGRSVNTVAVTTLKKMGVAPFRGRIADALDMGYGEQNKRIPGNLSIALGSSEMSPVELARLYSVLLNNGHAIRARMILKVLDKEGQQIWPVEEPLPPQGNSVLGPEACAGGIELMKAVLDPKYGGTVGWISKKKESDFSYLPFPVAGKTGTVQSVQAHRRKFPGFKGVHDVWFVGLVPNEVGVVWIGHDQGAPFEGSGSGTAARIWAAYAQRALAGNVNGDFPSLNKSPGDEPPPGDDIDGPGGRDPEPGKSKDPADPPSPPSSGPPPEPQDPAG